jgi:hypothetical protein
MGKRTLDQKPRAARDFYSTPEEAVRPLLRFLPPETRFAEPCAGDGRLIRHLEAAGHVCVDAGDIHPLAPGIRQCDARDFVCPDAAVYISNPPFAWPLVGGIIDHLMQHRPTWMLLEADWFHNARTARLVLRCSKIVSIGRLKWIEGSASAGKQNYVWANFDARLDGPTEFHGRAA